MQNALPGEVHWPALTHAVPMDDDMPASVDIPPSEPLTGIGFSQHAVVETVLMK